MRPRPAGISWWNKAVPPCRPPVKGNHSIAVDWNTAERRKSPAVDQQSSERQRRSPTLHKRSPANSRTPSPNVHTIKSPRSAFQEPPRRRGSPHGDAAAKRKSPVSGADRGRSPNMLQDATRPTMMHTSDPIVRAARVCASHAQNNGEGQSSENRRHLLVSAAEAPWAAAATISQSGWRHNCAWQGKHRLWRSRCSRGWSHGARAGRRSAQPHAQRQFHRCASGGSTCIARHAAADERHRDGREPTADRSRPAFPRDRRKSGARGIS